VTLTKQAALTTLVAAALAAGPVQTFAQGTNDPKPVDVKAELEDLKKQMAELKTTQKQMADVVLGRGEGRFPDEAGLQKRLEVLSDAMRRIEDKVTKLDEKVTKFGEQVAATQRTSGSSPLTGPAVNPHATVRLVNDFPTDVTVVLNGVVHQIAPAQKKEVAVAPGEFGYALPQSGGVESKARIRENETVTVRIR
jgi:hypothetical protein